MRKYGMSTLLPGTEKSFEDARFNEHYHLQGIHTYDILRNPIYTMQFQYFAADLEDRQDFIIDGDTDASNDCAQSDLVRIILNLAFLTPEDVKGMTFDPEGLQKLENK
jgi:hypothetical protein